MSLSSADFPQRVVAARRRLADEDPTGEEAAVAPLPSEYELLAKGQWVEPFHGLRADSDAA